MPPRNADHDMNINRDNYETFFLLYTDGELSAAAKEAVEAFCRLHPDLAEELQLLMDTRLQPDEGLHYGPLAGLLKPELWDADQLTPEQTQLLEQLENDVAPNGVEADAQLRSEWQLLQATRLPADAAETMPNKHRLIKPLPWDAAALTTAQQQLLAALDGEAPLPAALPADAELQAEWQLLQATRLPADEQLAMPHKDRLYRPQATDKAPIIKLGWQRWVAAAVLLGLGWAGLRLLPGADVQGPTALPVTVVQPAAPAPSGSGTTASTTTGSQPAAAADPATAASTTPAALLAAQAPQPSSATTTGTVVGRPAPATTVAEPLVARSTDTPPAGPQPTEASEDERHRLIAASRLRPEEEARLRPRAHTQPEQALRLPAAERTPSIAMLAAAYPADQPAQAQYAVQQETADADEDFINIGGAKINKQKLRGVFRVVGRKLSRTFDKSDVVAAEEAATRLR
jgi:hypothetical protein